MCQIWYSNVKDYRSYRSDMKTWQKPINLTLRSKVKIKSGTWMFVSHLLMVINPCVKNGKPMSNQKIVTGRTKKHVKNSTNLTLRSKFKVVSGSWMYATHRHMMILACPKYGNQCKKKLWPRHESAQTDGQIKWFLYTPLNFVHGGIMIAVDRKMKICRWWSWNILC